LRWISHLEVLLDPLLEPRYCRHPDLNLIFASSGSSVLWVSQGCF
jgi:hypothetical protein